MRSKNRKFRIGDFVLAKKQVLMRRRYKTHEHSDSVLGWRYYTTLKLPDNTRGFIIGAAYRHLGEVKRPSYYGGDDSNYLHSKERILVWEVKLGYLNKPIEVLEEDLEIIYSSFLPLEIPWLYTTPIPERLLKGFADEMREEMSKVPRDEKGRWLRWTSTGWVNKEGVVVKPLDTPIEEVK